jgi:hypothetical protein
MRGKKPTGSLGALDKFLDLALAAGKASSPKSPSKSTAPAPVPTTLSDLRDEICRRCGKPFETTRTDKIYCSYHCRNRMRVEGINAARAKAREGAVCLDCSVPIVRATLNQKRCRDCARVRDVAAERVRRRQRSKAGSSC